MGFGLWHTSAPPAFAVAPSGEVFVTRGASVPDRLSWLEAGGLPPLRHRGVPVTRACGDEICEIALPDRWRLVLHPPGAEPACEETRDPRTVHLLAEPADSSRDGLPDASAWSCGHRIAFSDPGVSAGQAWRLSPRGPRPVRPPCGAGLTGADAGGRPWAPCAGFP
mgnify:CR=1 FL=1